MVCRNIGCCICYSYDLDVSRPVTLEKLTIQNFQSIRDLSIDFGKFTVLVGRSSSGKSAILRAFHVLARNSFVPSYVRQGTTNTTIAATFDDGGVTTKRGKESTYILNQGGSDEIYTKCGRAVPDTVINFLRMAHLADEDLNFTNQFEMPFLVGGKSSRASAVVGTITNAVLVNSLAQETNRRRLGFLQKLHVRETDLESLKASLSEFSDLPRLEDVLGNVKSLENEIAFLNEQSIEVGKVMSGIVALRSKLVSLPDLPTVNATTLDNLKKLAHAESKLSEVAQRYNNLAKSRTPLPYLPEDVYVDIVGLRELDRQKDMLATWLLDAEAKQDAKDRTAIRVAEIHADVLALEQELSNVPVCETCGQPLLGA